MTNATPLMGPIHGVSNWTGGSFSSLAALGYNASKTTATQLGLRFSLAVLPNHATMGILMLGRGWELGYHLCTPPPLGRRAAWSVASTQCTVGIKEQHLTIVVFCLSSSHRCTVICPIPPLKGLMCLGEVYVKIGRIHLSPAEYLIILHNYT